MKQLQAFSEKFHEDMKWQINKEDYNDITLSLMNNYMLLTTEVAEVAEEFRNIFNLTNTYVNQGMKAEDAFLLAKEEVRVDLGKELADCLAYLVKFANFFEIDLEDSFYSKMAEVKHRKNKDVPLRNR